MKDIHLVLGSKSPRRQALIKELGFPFRIHTMEMEEIYPQDIDLEKVPEYLAELKAQPLVKDLNKNEILLTSDTVVLLEGEILGKPNDRDNSIEMLMKLSGKLHKVITGVCLQSSEKKITFSSYTDVYFSTLKPDDIIHYIDTFEPFDKAGSYGIQEWIGYIGIKKIDGCYYNVMGLPIHDVYQQLIKF